MNVIETSGMTVFSEWFKESIVHLSEIPARLYLAKCLKKTKRTNETNWKSFEASEEQEAARKLP